MSLGGTTDRTDTRPCDACGAVVEHRESFAYGGPTWWSANVHDAPCGAPCKGGSITSDTKRRLGVATFREALLLAHGRDACPRCGGGHKEPVA